jgi:hypothetical protein
MAELKTTDEEKETRSYLSWDDEDLGKLVKKKAIDLEDYYGENITEREAAVVSLVSRIDEAGNDMAMMEVEGIHVNGKNLGHWRITIEKVDADLPGGPPDPPTGDEDGDGGEGGVLIP